jgi:hypothetical protein
MVFAPKVIIHGVTFVIVVKVGLAFPAEHTATFPFWTTWKDPMETAS